MTGIIAGFMVFNDAPSVPAAQDEALMIEAATGKVVAIRYITLKEGVDPVEFERFIAEEYVVLRGSLPGLESMILKGDRGMNVDQYIWVLVFQSRHVRDLFYPEAGAPMIWDAVWEACGIEYHNLYDRFIEYIEPSEEYTDYVELVR